MSLLSFSACLEHKFALDLSFVNDASNQKEARVEEQQGLAGYRNHYRLEWFRYDLGN